MKLFEMKNWQLTTNEEVWGLTAFNRLLERDKSKDKSKVTKELLFIYFFCDIKSDYQYITNKEDRLQEIIKDINLPKTFSIDEDIQAAIDLYNKLTTTVIATLYKQTLASASAIGDYLENTEALLKERDNSGKPVTDISKLTTALGRVPKLMSDLKASYKEVVKEQEDIESKKKGSRSFNMFEEGL